MLATPVFHADLDGDRRPDAVWIRHRGNDLSGAPWFLVARLADGRLLARSLVHERTEPEDGLPCLMRCSIVGVGDLDRDGRSEVAVGVHTGASGSTVVLVHLSRGRLRDLTRGTRVPGFFVGAGARFGSALLCPRRDVVYASWGIDGPWIDVDERIYRPRGDTLAHVGDRHVRRPFGPSSPIPYRARACFR